MQPGTQPKKPSPKPKPKPKASPPPAQNKANPPPAQNKPANPPPAQPNSATNNSCQTCPKNAQKLCDVVRYFVKCTVLGEEKKVRQLTAPKRVRGQPVKGQVSDEIRALLGAYDLIIDCVAAYPSKEKALPDEKVQIETSAAYVTGPCGTSEHPYIVLKALTRCDELKSTNGALGWKDDKSAMKEFYAQSMTFDQNNWGGNIGFIFDWLSTMLPGFNLKLLQYEARSCGIADRTRSPNRNIVALVRLFRNDTWSVVIKLPPLGKLEHEQARSRNLATGATQTSSKTTTQGGFGYAKNERETKTETENGQTKVESSNTQYRGNRGTQETSKSEGGNVTGKRTSTDSIGREFQRTADGSRPEGDRWRQRQDGYARLIPERLQKPSGRITVSIKRNDREVNVAETIQKIAQALADVGETVKSALDALKRVPQAGWKVTVSLSLMEGSITGSWGPKMLDNPIDDRYFPVAINFKLAIALTIIEIKVELSFGFDADIGLGNKAVLKATGGFSCNVPLECVLASTHDEREVTLKPELKCEFKVEMEVSVFGWSLTSGKASIEGGIVVEGKFKFDPAGKMALNGVIKRKPIELSGYIRVTGIGNKAFKKEVYPGGEIGKF